MSFPYLDFFQMLHCMASFYIPNKIVKNSFICMFHSVIDMIPKNDQVSVILTEALRKYPLDNEALKNSTNLLKWSYQINAYFHRQYYGTHYNTTLVEHVNKYTHENIRMSTWSRPTWKLLHYFPSKYNRTSEYALSYKAFVSCLQFLLPCPKCKEHLKNNLSNFPIDEYFSSPYELFEWSYLLHETVSKQTNKTGIPLHEALMIHGL